MTEHLTAASAYSSSAAFTHLDHSNNNDIHSYANRMLIQHACEEARDLALKYLSVQ